MPVCRKFPYILPLQKQVREKSMGKRPYLLGAILVSSGMVCQSLISRLIFDDWKGWGGGIVRCLWEYSGPPGLRIDNSDSNGILDHFYRFTDTDFFDDVGSVLLGRFRADAENVADLAGGAPFHQ